MRPWIRQYAIALTGLYACAAFTVITPFYPAVALRSGIPSSLIGLIFSAFPISSIITSFFLPKTMLLIGRHTTLILSLFLIGSGCILVSFIESLSPAMALTISLISRIITGSGAACGVISSSSILSSDYPEKLQSLSAVIEFFIGLGTIIGPLAGSLLYSLGGFSLSCRIIGLFVYSYIPIILLLLGKARKHVVKEKVKISIWEVCKKPKVFLNAFIGFIFMYSVGVTMPTIEPHVLSYGIDEEYVGYWYSLYTGAYCTSALIMTRLNSLPKQKTMFTGLCLVIIAMVLLGPCPFVFDRNVYMAAAGHHLMGWAISIMYSKDYLVPLMPYLIEVSHNEYNIPNDDRLNDSVSSIVNIFFCSGEIFGPIAGSLLPEFYEEGLKYRITYMITSIIFALYAAAYVIANCVLSRNQKKFDKDDGKEVSMKLLNKDN